MKKDSLYSEGSRCKDKASGSLICRYLFLLCLCLMAAGILSGCSRKRDMSPPCDFTVQVEDSQGLTASSPVQWRGVEVGCVDTVKIDKGMVQVGIRLHEPYRGTFREDLRARPARGFLGRGPTILELYGGDDSRRPMLQQGSVIAEASMSDLLTPGQLRAIILVAIVVVLLIAVLSVIKKVLAFSLAVCFLVISGWFVLHQWQKHSKELESFRVEMEWSDMAKDILTEEAAREAWFAVQADLLESVRDVGRLGKEQASKVSEEVRKQMDLKAEKLIQDGKDLAAQELRKLKEEMLSPGE